MHARRVIVAFDEDGARRSALARLIQPLPHALVLARDLADARARLWEAKPDLVLLACSGAAEPVAKLASEWRERADELSARVVVLHPRAGSHSVAGLFPSADDVVGLPLSPVTLQQLLEDLAAARAQAFVTDALQLTVEPPEATSPTPDVVDTDEQLRPLSEPVVDATQTMEAVRSVVMDAPDTNASDTVAGAADLASLPAPAAGEVFSDVAKTPPDGSPGPLEPAAQDAPFHAASAAAAASPQGHAVHIRLDAPPLPTSVETTSALRPGTRPGSVRVLDESILGAEATRRLVGLYRGLAELSPYTLLGVGRGADAAEIRTAYLVAARELHPDRFMLLPAGPVRECARAVFTRMALAVGELVHPARRAALDQRLDQDRTGSARLPPLEDLNPAASATTTAPLLPPPPAPARPAVEITGTWEALGSALESVQPATDSDDGLPDPASGALTAGGRTYMRLALQQLARGDPAGARLNMTFALGYEPNNQDFQARLQALDQEHPSAAE